MPIYQCSACGCAENTATSNYWQTIGTDKPKLCSECDPEIGKWHGMFPKMSAVGYLLGNDGFLYHPDQESSGQLDWRKEHQGFEIIGRVDK